MKTPQNPALAAVSGLLFLLITGCSGTETKNQAATTTESSDSISVQLDSAENRIEHAAEQLENKTRELEKSLDNLDTTTLSN